MKLATISMENADLGATGTDFMAILQNVLKFLQHSSQAFLNMKCWL